MPARRRSTLADVAARAGVSVTTASYVLNRRADEMRISVVASDRVRRAAEELSYRPNRSARSLRTSRTATIGVISDHVASGHYASQMLSGAAAEARARGHLVMIAESEGDPVLEQQLVEEMIDHQVDGILYTTLVARRVDLPASLRGVPTVLLNCTDPASAWPSIIPDEVAGGRLAARTIAAAGAGERLFVVGEDPTPDAFAGVRRLVGIHEGLGEAGVGVAGVVPCAWDVRPAHDAVAAWLRTGPRPTGLVCLNDRIAMGAYQALAGHGLSVPDDVSVVAFDGSGLATWLRPELTSVAIPFSEMGSRAVTRLVEGGPTDSPDGSDELVSMPLMPGASVRSAPDLARQRHDG